MATVKKVKKIEERLTMVEKFLERIVEQLKLMETQGNRISECERKLEDRISVDVSETSKQVTSESNDDLLSRLAVSELTTEERIGKLETQITEVGDKAMALGLRFQEFKEEFPTPAETGLKSVEQVVKSNDDRNSMSCGEMLRTTKESVLIVGDSIARGVGDKLRSQGGKVFDRFSRGGARIDSVGNEILKLEDDSNRHVVVMAGTNNLESDDSSDILEQYEKLLDNARKVKHRQVTVVGIVKRYDLRSSFESKRIVVNMRLKEMCRKKNIAFLEFDPERSQMGKDLLHLNEEGQTELAIKIFGHCLPFLC